MATPSSSNHDPHTGKSRLLRWAGLLIASILLHLFALDWASGRIGMPGFTNQSPTVVTTELRAVPPPRETVAAAAAAAPAIPAPKPRKRRPASPLPAPEPVVEIAESSPPVGMEAPGTSVEPAIETAAADTPSADADIDSAAQVAESAVQPEEQAARYKFDPPPSVELSYDVFSLRGVQKVYGRGKINWQAAGNNYTITGEAGVMFFSVLDFKSEGMIDESGVAPVIYSEKRFRKPATNTHFHRERNTISFSASTLAYPRKGGEQDRASIIWQLAAIGRGDSTAYAPDAEIELFVAGARDAETWRIRVIGREELEVGTGKVSTWHVVRLPRPGSYDQKLDIWLAPQQEWYPVKLRYTETNGDFLDMSLSNTNVVTER